MAPQFVPMAPWWQVAPTPLYSWGGLRALPPGGGCQPVLHEPWSECKSGLPHGPLWSVYMGLCVHRPRPHGPLWCTRGCVYTACAPTALTGVHGICNPSQPLQSTHSEPGVSLPHLPGQVSLLIPAIEGLL